MRIAVIGTGMVGRTLGEGLAKVGHDVVVGTRDPARTRARDEWGATSLSLASYGQIGVGADLFINATSGDASLEALQAVGDEAGPAMMPTLVPPWLRCQQIWAGPM